MSTAREALIVATDSYEDPRLRQLESPAHDAASLAAVLGDPEIGAFSVTRATNESEHRLRRTLSRFYADRSVDDLLLVHFSCHGLKNDAGDLYFAATDTELDHLDATAISSDFVNRMIEESRSRRVILLLDCCYGGAYRRAMTHRAGASVEIRERLAGRGRVVLTASSAMEYVWEGATRTGDAVPSRFTSAIVHGLSTGEADRNGDQWISIGELYDYVYERLMRQREAEDVPRQTPGMWGMVEGELLVARSNRRDRVRELPADLSAATRNPFADVRIGAVRELRELLGSGEPTVREAARRALEGMREDAVREVRTAAGHAFTAVRAPPPAIVPEPQLAATAGPNTIPLADLPLLRPVPPVEPVFEMAAHLVTNRQFRAFLSANPVWQRERVERGVVDDRYLEILPEGGEGDDVPVVGVSYHAASAYAEWAGERLGKELRVPFEREWQEAAAAGRPDGWIEAEIAAGRVGFRGRSRGPHPAGWLGENPYGISDLIGNVRDLCLAADGEHVLACGGHWDTSRGQLDGPCLRLDHDECRGDVGFRCAHDLARSGGDG